MEVKQCEFCRAPFQTMGGKLCGDCHKQLDEDFIMIREYLYENEGAGIEEVSEATGVPRKIILYLLKEERLIVSGNKGGGILVCESCKRPINTGRMCGRCKKEVVSAMQQNIAPTPRPKRRVEEEEEESIKGVAKLQVK